MDSKSFEGLEVWQKAHELSLVVHREEVPRLPAEERWDLAAQIRRSAKSIPANIAEGHGRYYFGDNVRFCYNARGSLYETISHLLTARDLNYIDAELYSRTRNLADSIYRLLNGYIAFLKRRRIGADEPSATIQTSEVPVPDDPG